MPGRTEIPGNRLAFFIDEIYRKALSPRFFRDLDGIAETVDVFRVKNSVPGNKTKRFSVPEDPSDVFSLLNKRSIGFPGASVFEDHNILVFSGCEPENGQYC